MIDAAKSMLVKLEEGEIPDSPHMNASTFLRKVYNSIPYFAQIALPGGANGPAGYLTGREALKHMINTLHDTFHEAWSSPLPPLRATATSWGKINKRQSQRLPGLPPEEGRLTKAAENLSEALP